MRAQKNHLLEWPRGQGTFEGMMVGFSHMLVTSDQHCDRPAADVGIFPVPGCTEAVWTLPDYFGHLFAVFNYT